MIQSPAWFERKFSFELLPLSMFPNVLERVRGTPVRVEDRVRNLPREVLTRRDGERWSAQEHAGHLLDLEPMEMMRLEDYAAGREMLTPADLQNRKTFEANHNEQEMADILLAFRAERMEFVSRLEEMDEAFIARTAIHPRLKIPMRVIDFAFFKAEHDDHHLARISELLRKFS